MNGLYLWCISYYNFMFVNHYFLHMGICFVAPYLVDKKQSHFLQASQIIFKQQSGFLKTSKVVMFPKTIAN